MQEQLRDLQIAELAFPHRPILLGDCPETPDQDQYNSAWEDAEEDEGDATSQPDAKFDASMGKEMDASRHLCRSLLADRHHQRNCALHRECNQTQ